MKQRSNLVEHILTFVVLLILLAYTYMILFIDPFIGFHFNSQTGRIELIIATVNEEDSLQVGDKLKRVGTVTWEEYRANQRQPLFENALPGKIVEIAISRGNKTVPVNWTIPGINIAEFLERIADTWMLSYYFWLAGLATVLIIRPADWRRTLLIAFFYLTALWLMFGATGETHLWHSAIFFRMTIWLSLPVYLHLHWIFPEPIVTLHPILYQ